MKAIAALLATLVLAAIVVVGLNIFGQETDYRITQHYAPKYEDVRRTTFEHSRAYNQGTVQNLSMDYQEYLGASPEHKAALRSLILHRYADYPTESMPPYLAEFYTGLQNPGPTVVVPTTAQPTVTPSQY